jgi:tetratricopeptide (TPR) repeat protein
MAAACLAVVLLSGSPLRAEARTLLHPPPVPIGTEVTVDGKKVEVKEGQPVPPTRVEQKGSQCQVVLELAPSDSRRTASFMIPERQHARNLRLNLEGPIFAAKVAHEGTGKEVIYREPPRVSDKYRLTCLSAGSYIFVATKSPGNQAQGRAVLSYDLAGRDAPEGYDRNSFVQHYMRGITFDRQSRSARSDEESKRLAEQAVQEYDQALRRENDRDVQRRKGFLSHWLEGGAVAKRANEALARQDYSRALSEVPTVIREYKAALACEPNNQAIKKWIGEWRAVEKNLQRNALAPPQPQPQPQPQPPRLRPQPQPQPQPPRPQPQPQPQPPRPQPPRPEDPAVQQLIEQASAAYNARNYERAQSLLQDALRRSPNNGRAQELLEMVRQKQATQGGTAPSGPSAEGGAAGSDWKYGKPPQSNEEGTGKYGDRPQAH